MATKTTTLTEFLHAINDAFARGDVAFFADKLTDDARWSMVGEGAPIVGREAVLAAMEEGATGALPEIQVASMITHGEEAAVHGTMTLADDDGVPRTYAFCDIYRFRGFKDPKIRELTSFVIETGGEGTAG